MKKNMGMIWLLLGGCFLWNPVVGVRDLLPDVIGYFLICLGLSRLADLNDDLAQAQKAFRSMLWVGFAQLAAWLLVSGFLQKNEMDMNRYEEPVWVLLFAFVFLVLEWYFLLSGWKLFFRGLTDLAEYHGGSAILTERRGRSWGDRMISCTRAFVICKTVLTLLPETSVLTSFETEAESQVFLFDWFPFLSAFRTIAVLIGTVIGVIWLVSYLRFMSAAVKDEPWQERLQERYRKEILPDTGLLLNRRVGFAFSFFRVGILFFVNLTVLYRELLPDWGAALFILCGIFLLGSLPANRKPYLIAGGALTVIGIARTWLNGRFLADDYIPVATLYSPDAYQAYLPVRIMSWIEAGLAFVFIVSVVKLLLNLVKEHTAVDYGGDLALSKRATERLHDRMRRKSIPVVAGWGLSSVCKILEVELQPQYGWIWLIQFCASLVSVLLFVSFLNELANLIADRYPAKKSV